ncbi:GL13831 [Drosophila persimilis]|uniref:GL13831 n=1 Tax=Drosophila persimilis TaxID=7234 RepID=B4GP80_DROPE|nr:GL13831 [Drosophila persimilis]
MLEIRDQADHTMVHLMQKFLLANNALKKHPRGKFFLPTEARAAIESLKKALTTALGRLARWSLQLQRFDFVIEHRKGVENIVADTLSRCIEEVVLDPTEILGRH